VTTTVFLVRHGSHDRLGKVLCGRMDGVSLSDRGKQEAEAVARRLAGEGLAAVYTSPLSRTRETAEPIARAAGLEPIAEDDLLEIDFGAWTGRAFAELEGDGAWVRWNRERAAARPPGGESMAQVQARLERWLERAWSRRPGERIAAVTHADVIKAVVADVLGFSLDRHDRLEVTPGSVSILAGGDWGAKVISLNEVAA
jgi:probable phosphoglycerate mutase